MKVGDNIRNLRTLRGLSQENVADLLDMSLVAYGDIERNKKDINLSRLEQISRIFDVSVVDILDFENKIELFFTRSKDKNHLSNINILGDIKEMSFELEKMQLILEKMKIEKEKADLEAKYWREKFEK